MSQTTTIARRYASALYQEAESEGQVEQVDAGIEAVRETLSESPELERLFASPVISTEKKSAIVRRLFEGKVEPLVLNTMLLLIEKGREEMVPDVVRAYAVLRDERLGVVEALVKTALPLAADETEALRDALEKSTGHNIRLRLEVEPELIGGLVVRVGDTVYDGSARHQLEMLREQFATRVYMSN